MIKSNVPPQVSYSTDQSLSIRLLLNSKINVTTDHTAPQTASIPIKKHTPTSLFAVNINGI